MAIDTIDTPVSSTIRLNRPIPGQGLTSDPENPYPWEKPPEFTDLEDGLQYVFGRLINPEAYVSIMNVIDDGTALMDITQGILFKGFTEGKWNPDLMMMLAEPTTYMLMALAERADIDFKVYKGEEEDEDAEATLFNIDIDKQKLKELRSVSKSQEIPKGMIPKEIEEQIEELPASSLLSKPEEEEPEDSLLGRTST
jgi:hypothetical protein|tara:strand:+ start:36 stop:626 length:591 start_codon:yes stop_codon:yes gene_type:complete